uniref:Uncharacterized protein n=1 Tax=Triticum urartu TaxID=4572 RepID=A0A8R7K559_TRIUA
SSPLFLSGPWPATRIHPWRASQRGAAEGAEAELRVDGAAARAALPRPRAGEELPAAGAVGPRREEAAVAAEVGGVLARPPPRGDEEELEHLLGLHQVGRAAAAHAPPGRLLEHPPRALLHAAYEEEEHRRASRSLPISSEFFSRDPSLPRFSAPVDLARFDLMKCWFDGSV